MHHSDNSQMPLRLWLTVEIVLLKSSDGNCINVVPKNPQVSSCVCVSLQFEILIYFIHLPVPFVQFIARSYFKYIVLVGIL